MINDLKDFEKMLKICRKAGVDEIFINGLAVKFGADPSLIQQSPGEPVPEELSAEELMHRAVYG